MLKVKGTTLYPATVFEALNGIPEVTEYLLRATRVEGVDTLHVELSLALDTPALRQQVEAALLARLRVRVGLSVVDEATLRKPIRFLDLRS
jgi:phenylacetate-coenzyme A ligase PaaK-like adenylate-forming protein